MTGARCALASAARDEPMFATASPVRRWLAVEQPGPWGPESVPAARMAPTTYRAARRLAEEAGARLVLIRRSQGVAPEAGRRVFLADTHPGDESLRTALVDRHGGLARLQLDAPDWRPVDYPIYLTCTHGRHDPCCAVFGRPVGLALAVHAGPGQAWESSHLGGDRFAGNVLVLPYGLYLGRVTPADVPGVLDSLAHGRMPLDLLRGRSGLSTPAQAAEYFARRETGRDGIADLRPIATLRASEPGEWDVVLGYGDGELVVTVRRRLSAAPHFLTCHSTEARRFPQFELVSIRRR